MSHDFFFFFEPNLFLYNFDKTETWWKGVKPAVKTRPTSNLPGPCGWASLSCVLEQIESDQRSVSIRLKQKQKQRQVRRAKGLILWRKKARLLQKGGKVRCTHAILIEWRGDCGRKRLEDALHIHTSGCLCHIQKNIVASWKTCLNLGTVIYITAYLHHFYLSFSE